MPYFRNHNNLNLYYEFINGKDQNLLDKLPVIFLHGFGSSANFFQEQVRILKKEFRLLLFDAEGHGKSDKNPKEKLTDHLMDTTIEDLTELLYLLRIDGQFGLICHSLAGGSIGLKLAIESPERVKFLVLLNSGAILIDNPIRNVFWNLLPQNIRVNFKELILDNVNVLLDKTIPFIRGAILDEEEYTEFQSQKIDTIIENEIFSMIKNPLNLEKIKCPTLIVGGELDNYAPLWMSRELSNKIPNSKFEIVSMAGHFGPSQRFDAYNKIIIEFLNSIGIKF